ncbi:MAG: AI-2E family transporter [Bacteroidota bacterium]
MTDKSLMKNILEAAIRIGILFILIAWCFKILEPFLGIMMWGVIIAVTMYPLHRMMRSKLGGRNMLSAVLLTLVLLLVIIVPCLFLGDSMISGMQSLVTLYQSGQLKLPAPMPSVKYWPVIGNEIYSQWMTAYQNPGEVLKVYGPQLATAFSWVVSFISQAGMGFLMMLASIAVSGVFLVYSDQGGAAAHSFFIRLAGDRGGNFAKVTEVTIRNVARGIIGVAFIQAALAGIGFLAAGVPLAGLWALIALLMAIVQVGVTPVSIAVIIYMFSTAGTMTAVLLTIWLILVSLSDNLLKPLLLGKGAPVPMLVIFLGSIGGFIFEGFMGLFLGAIALSIGYKLVLAWLDDSEPGNKVTGDASE